MRVYGTKSKILQHSEALFRSLEEQGTQNCFYDGGCLWLPMPALAGPGSQSVLREARPCDVMRESSRSSCSGVIAALCIVRVCSTALNLPRDFSTELALMTLHLWVLHNRFKVDYDGSGIYSGRRLQVGDVCMVGW